MKKKTLIAGIVGIMMLSAMPAFAATPHHHDSATIQQVSAHNDHHKKEVKPAHHKEVKPTHHKDVKPAPPPAKKVHHKKHKPDPPAPVHDTIGKGNSSK